MYVMYVMQYNVMLEITCDCNNPHTVFNESVDFCRTKLRRLLECAVCTQHSLCCHEGKHSAAGCFVSGKAALLSLYCI